VHDHADLIFRSRVLTTDQWGDYLIYTNPRHKVFVDGRSDFYGPEIGNDYIRLINGHWEWRRLLDKYRFEAALLPAESAIAQLLKQSAEWRIVADNGKQVLLVLRTVLVPSTGKSPAGPTF
jgi:hypothetical protein